MPGRLPAAQLAQHFQSAHAGHHLVQENQVNGPAFRDLQCDLAIQCRFYAIPGLGQPSREHIQIQFFVVDYQDLGNSCHGYLLS